MFLKQKIFEESKKLFLHPNININIRSSLFYQANYKNFSTEEAVYTKKDYYFILGLNRTATIQEIKKAYRKLAKVYHPDVRSKTESNQNTIIALQNFRDIAEAYAVLSNTFSKYQYDITYKPKPEAVFNSTKMKSMNVSAEERDANGNTYKEPYEEGSYGEKRIEMLKKWQKQFNFDHLGNFKGGVPRRHKGPYRGNSVGVVGEPYDTYYHNEEFFDNAMKPVQSKDAIDHRLWNNNRKEQNLRFKPYFNIEKIKLVEEHYEQSSEYRNLMRWPLLFFIIVSSYIVGNRLWTDYQYQTLSEFTRNLKAHEYEWLGPVVILADYFKFHKKFLTKKEYHLWIDNDLRTFKDNLNKKEH